MDTERFDELAAKILADCASTEERKECDQALSKSPELKKEFLQMEETYRLLREQSPLASAMNTEEPALPEYRLERLRSAVTKEFRGKEKVSGPQGFPFWRLIRQLTASLAVLMIVGVLYMYSLPSVEIGMVPVETTRGNNPTSPLKYPGVATKGFPDENGFLRWQNHFWRPGLHARIWVDEGQDSLVILRRNGTREEHPLPEDPTRRLEIIKIIINSAQTPVR